MPVNKREESINGNLHFMTGKFFCGFLIAFMGLELSFEFIIFGTSLVQDDPKTSTERSQLFCSFSLLCFTYLCSRRFFRSRLTCKTAINHEGMSEEYTIYETNFVILSSAFSIDL